MATYIDFQPSDFFNTVLYNGTGSSHAVTGVGFQPDITWIKNRPSNYSHVIFDSVRGVQERLVVNTDDSESNDSAMLTAWGADGFTLGSSNEVNRAGGDGYVGWNWKAGTTTGLSGGTHAVTSYSYNATSGFGIYTYSGDNTAGTIAHGLGAVPRMIITKRLNTAQDWFNYDANVGKAQYINLNTTAGEAGSVVMWNNTLPTSTVFSLGAGAEANTSGNDYVAYVFAEKKGYSRIGGYQGNGNADGPFVYTGFRPAWVMCRMPSGAFTGNWVINDNKRPGYNVNQNVLFANASTLETTTAPFACDLLSNGFKFRGSESDVNSNGYNYIYMAFAEYPLVSSNSKAGVAR